MPADERADRATRLRAIAEARTPAHWLDDQLAAAGRLRLRASAGASSAPSGPSTSEVRPAASSSSETSGVRTATLTAVTPALGQAVERLEGGEVADVVADVGHRRQAVGSLLDHGALVDGDGRVQLEATSWRAAGAGRSARRRPRAHSHRGVLGLGHPPEVQREREALVLDVDARAGPTASVASAAASSMTGRHRLGVGSLR